MLSSQEIDHIRALLLSPDSNNVLLALTLLEEQAAAVQALLLPLEVALTYSEHREAIIQLLQKHAHSVAWRQLPLYAFYHTIADTQTSISTEQRPLIRRFIRQESMYRPYLLEDSKKAFLYVDGAAFMEVEEEFVTTAHEFYQLALAHLPADAYVYSKYADFLRQHPPQGESIYSLQDTIASYYKKAYALKKEKYLLHTLANFYAYDLEEAATARQTWQWCLQEHPNYGGAWLAWAKLEIAEQQWGIAKKLLQKALALQEAGIWVDLDQAYYLLGTVYWKGEDDWKKASHYFELALEENKYYAAPLEALLQISAEHQDYQKAILWHQLALQLQPMNIFLLLQLAQLYTQTENHDKAIATYEEILELHPGYSPAVEGLAKLKNF